MDKNTEVFAFPHDEFVDMGMTLRDYFAAKAMQGLISDPDFTGAETLETAIWSYKIADAMLKAREE
jgi:hypothetical protein